MLHFLVECREAIKEYQNIIQIAPIKTRASFYTTHRVFTTYGGLGAIYEQLGEYDKALEMYKKASELKSTTVTYFCIGNIYLKKNRYHDATKYLEKSKELLKKEYKIKKIPPRLSVKIHLALGKTYKILELDEKAQIIFAENADLLRELKKYYEKEKETPLIIRTAKEVLSENPAIYVYLGLSGLFGLFVLVILIHKRKQK